MLGSEKRSSAVLRRAAASLMLAACSKASWSGQIEPWPIPTAGTDGPFGLDAGVAGALDAGSDAALDGASDVDAGSAINASFELFLPWDVYLLGTLREGDCNLGALAPPWNASAAVLGLPCEVRAAQLRPSDGRLLYMSDFFSPPGVYLFHVDARLVSDLSQSPQNPIANDELLVPSPCPQGDAVSFLISLDSEVVLFCQSSQSWYDAHGAMLPGSGYLSFGANRTVLTTNGILNLDTKQVAPVTGLPTGEPLAVRALADGSYWLAMPGSTALAGTQGDAGPPDLPELWRVQSDGTASRTGIYPALPAQQRLPESAASSRVALDSQGRLVQIAVDESAASNDTVIRRSTDGTSAILYTEADDPPVKIDDFSRLVTGP